MVAFIIAKRNSIITYKIQRRKIMKVNSSNVKKIKKDVSEKGDLCAGVEETQGLNKELVLLEAGKAFVDGIFY